MTRRSLSVLLLVVVVVGCGGSDGAKGPTATVGAERTTESTTTTTAKALTPEQEVEAAYLKSWDVYAKAMRTLDGSHLSDSYADDALALRQDEIAGLKQKNTPAVMKVDHGYTVTLLAPDRAVVIDDYRNHSTLIDPKTGTPTEPDPNNQLKRKYDLRKDGDRWVIVAVTSLS
jgi:hypothetical protein